MTRIHDWVYRLSKGMRWVAGICQIVMLLAILADVISRGLYKATGGVVDLTFIGGIEIVGYALLFMVMFTLPYAVERGQVIVDLFTDHFSARLKATLTGVFMLGYTLLAAGMAWRFIHAVDSAAASGQLTQDLLIPMQYLYAITAVSAAVLALRALTVAVQCFIAPPTATEEGPAI